MPIPVTWVDDAGVEIVSGCIFGNTYTSMSTVGEYPFAYSNFGSLRGRMAYGEDPNAYIVVADPSANTDSGFFTGRVFVIKGSGGSQYNVGPAQGITMPADHPDVLNSSSYANGLRYGSFGNSVSASGTYIAVAVPRWGVWIYTYTGQYYRYIDCFDSNNTSNITLTNAVLSGDFVYVSEAAVGYQYVKCYNIHTGTLSYTIQNPNTGTQTPNGDLFGYSIAVHGNTLVVGAPYFIQSGNWYVGRIYIFNATTGDLTSTLVCPTNTSWTQMGVSLDLNENYIVAGLNTNSGYNGGIRVWTLDGTYYRQIPATLLGSSDVSSVAIMSPSSNAVLATYSNSTGSVYGYNMFTGAHIWTHPRPQSYHSNPSVITWKTTGAACVGYETWDSNIQSHIGVYNRGIYSLNATFGTYELISNPYPDYTTWDYFGQNVWLDENKNHALISSVNDGHYIIDITTRNVVKSINFPGTYDNGVFIKDGIYAMGRSGANDGAFVVYDYVNDVTIASLDAASTDGKYICFNNSYIFLNSTTTDSVKCYSRPGLGMTQITDPNGAGTNFGYSLRISPSGNKIVIGNDGTNSVWVFDANSLTPVTELVAPADASDFGLELSVSERYIAVGGYDNIVYLSRVWVYDALTYEFLYYISDPGFEDEEVGFETYAGTDRGNLACNDYYLAVGGYDAPLYVYNAQTSELITRLQDQELTDPYYEWPAFSGNVALSFGKNKLIVGAPETPNEIGWNSGRIIIF